MRIYSMTATFGKLEHETLTLQPGLNVIEAANEWGKSTWCAFLVAMLYGIETRVHTTKTALADKERYAPWSGKPMSGRIDLEWNGRDITIERSTKPKGRVIFGEFSAFETHTHVAVPELTAANCGQMLLGVEKSVFTRSGFLRLSDLPVTQDESLRRRLNALVTTGDESGASDALAQKLKDLKNRCRANRANGLIPQVQAQKEELEGKLHQLHQLQEQSASLRQRQTQLEEFHEKLLNHQTALQYVAARSNAQRVADAIAAKETAAANAAALENTCQGLPDQQTARQKLQQLKDLQEESLSLQMEAQMLPQPPAPPPIPSQFSDLSPAEAAIKTQKDVKDYTSCKSPARPLLILFTALAALIVSIVFFYTENTPVGISLALISAMSFILALIKRRMLTRQARAIEQEYGSNDPEMWAALLQQYADSQTAYHQAMAQYQATQETYRSRQSALQQKISLSTNGEDLHSCQNRWQLVLASHLALEDAQREARKAASHAEALQAVAKPVEPPRFADALTYSEAETARMLSDCVYERHQLQRRLGHCQGQMESLGLETVLQQELDAVNSRLRKLEDTYAALEIAQDTLLAATKELQRRFAPRISQRAQALFAKLTDNRYDRLTLGEDLTLSAGAQNEDTLHTAMWRSDGTIDQLYLALRLAVAEELTPDAPLILDDALVRFDDTRLAQAMEILKEEAQAKQVILFTCQGRETALL